ncbi:putative protection of telomeres protein [Helianthus anomalus]
MKNGRNANGIESRSCASPGLLKLQVIAKFRCVVRVVATLPDHPRDFKAPCGTYRIRLTLEDPTARIHVYIYAEDGVKFFGGYPSIDTMIKKHNALLGVEETKCRFR